MKSQKKKRLLIIGAGGGHLTEAMLATEGVNAERIFVTLKLPHTDKSLEGFKKYYLIDPHTSLIKYGMNAIQSLWLIAITRPHAIVNTGGGISLACSLIGKFFGSKLIFIESGCRVEEPSKTGLFLYKYSDLFIVQWESMLEHFPDAVYGGLLL